MDHESALDAIFALDENEEVTNGKEEAGSQPGDGDLASATQPVGVVAENSAAVPSSLSIIDEIFGALDEELEKKDTNTLADVQARVDEAVPAADQVPPASEVSTADRDSSDVASIVTDQTATSAQHSAKKSNDKDDVWDEGALSDLEREISQVHPDGDLICRICISRGYIPQQHRAVVWAVILKGILASMDRAYPGSPSNLGSPREHTTIAIPPHVLDILRTELKALVDKNTQYAFIDVDAALVFIAEQLKTFGLRWWEGACDVYAVVSTVVRDANGNLSPDWKSTEDAISHIFRLIFKIFTHASLGNHAQRTNQKGEWESRDRHRLLYTIMKYLDARLVCFLDDNCKGWWRSEDDDAPMCNPGSDSSDDNDGPEGTGRTNNGNGNGALEGVMTRGCIPRYLLSGGLFALGSAQGLPVSFTHTLLDKLLLGMHSSQIIVSPCPELASPAWRRYSYPLFGPICQSPSMLLPSLLMAAALLVRESGSLQTAVSPAASSDVAQASNAYVVRMHLDSALARFTASMRLAAAVDGGAMQLLQEAVSLEQQLPCTLLENICTVTDDTTWFDLRAGEVMPYPQIAAREVGTQAVFGWPAVLKLAQSLGNWNLMTSRHELLPALQLSNSISPHRNLSSFLSGHGQGSTSQSLPPYLAQPCRFMLIDCRPLVHRRSGRLSVGFPIDPRTCQSAGDEAHLVSAEAEVVVTDASHADPLLVGVPLKDAVIQLSALSNAQPDLHFVISGVGVKHAAAAYEEDLLEPCFQQDLQRQRTVLTSLVAGGCNRVSVVNGGFAELHRLLKSPAMLWPIPGDIPDEKPVIIDHIPRRCPCCRHAAILAAASKPEEPLDAIIDTMAAVEEKLKSGFKNLTDAGKERATAVAHWMQSLKSKDQVTEMQGGALGDDARDLKSADTSLSDAPKQDDAVARAPRVSTGKVFAFAKAAKSAVIEAGRAALSVPQEGGADRIQIKRPSITAEREQKLPSPAHAVPDRGAHQSGELPSDVPKDAVGFMRKLPSVFKRNTIESTDGASKPSTFASFAAKLSAAASATQSKTTKPDVLDTEHASLCAELALLSHGADFDIVRFGSIAQLFPCEKDKPLHEAESPAPHERVPRYLCLCKNRLLVLKANPTKLGHAEIKSNRSIAQVAKLAYSKKDTTRIAVHFRKAGPEGHEEVRVNVYFMTEPQSFITAMQAAVTAMPGKR